MVLQLLHVLLWSLSPVPSMVKMLTVSRGWPSLLSCGCVELLDSPTLWGSHSSSPDKDLFSGLSLLVSQFHWFLSCYSHFLAGSLPNHCPTNLPFLSFSLCSMRDFPDTRNLSFCYCYNPTPIWITRSFPFLERDDSLFPGQCRGCLRRVCRRVGRPVL